MSINDQSMRSSKKQNFKDLQISIDSATNASVWMAKKQRAQIERHINIMKNRLALLNQEEIKAKKKISEMKKKTNDLFNLKVMNYNEQMARANYKNNADSDLEAKHQRSLDYRLRQRENMKNLRSDLKSLKKQESMDIKIVSKENTEKLRFLREEGLRMKREKVNKVKSGVLTSKKKIEYYWDQRKRYYTEQHALEALENEHTKAYLEKELEILEKDEMVLLERLEKTQDVQNKLYDKFEEFFTMSACEIGEKQMKNDQNNKKKALKKKKTAKSKSNHENGKKDEEKQENDIENQESK